MTRRASILLEVLLAIAIFVFAGIVVLGVMEETVAASGRAARRAVAMDLARTRMAELEAGYAEQDVAEELGGGGGGGGGAGAGGGVALGSTAVDSRRGLRVESRTEPSEFGDLQLAVVEVWDDAAPTPTAFAQAMGSAESDPPRLAVLRQLIHSADVATRGAPARNAPARDTPPRNAPVRGKVK